MDFSSLVLAPCMEVFQQPGGIVVAPDKSQPGAPAYEARGIWESRHIDIPMDDGTVISSNQIDVGIRLSEFAVAPIKDDGITVAGVAYAVFDVQNDGQGGAKLILRKA